MDGIEYQEYDSSETQGHTSRLLAGDRFTEEKESEKHGEYRSQSAQDGRVNRG